MTGSTLYPAAIAVSPAGRQLTRRTAVRHLSGLARLAACLSAQRAQLPVPVFGKDERGVPLPEGDNWWSLSHKKAMVAGLTAPLQAGIDIEKIRPVQKGLYAKTAAPEEWKLLADTGEAAFFHAWTAKEAVLKAAGSGIGYLLACRIVTRQAEDCLVLRYRERDWIVRQTVFAGHLAAVAMHDEMKISWQVIKENGP